jgi:hypothetical protein
MYQEDDAQNATANEAKKSLSIRVSRFQDKQAQKMPRRNRNTVEK